MTKKYLQTLQDWSKGMNDKDAPNLIADNALVDVENAIIGKGYIEKRFGYQVYSSNLTNAVTKLYELFKSDNTTEFLSVSNKTLYKDASGTFNAVPFNTITELSSNDVQLMTYKDRSINDVVLLADKGKLKVYDGTEVKEVTPHTPTTEEQTDPGLNDLANLTNFRAIAIKKDRIFAAAHPTVKNRISFCHHDPTLGYAVYDYFPATFFFDVAASENDEITQLKVFRDALIVLCKRSIWVLYGDGRTINDYELHQINVPSGCISPKSVAIVGNDMFYLSDDHVYSLYATEENFVSATIISENVESTLKSITRADKEKAVAAFFDNKYFLSFPSGLTLVYDTLLKVWSKWTNVQANSFLDKDGVFYFASDNGNVYNFDETIYNDDGQPISFSMTTKNMSFDYDVQEKKFKKLWTVAKQYDEQSSSFNVKAKIDYVTIDITDISTDQSMVLGEGELGSAMLGFTDVVQNELKVREKGKNIQLIISNNTIDEPLTLYGLVLQYKIKKP